MKKQKDKLTPKQLNKHFLKTNVEEINDLLKDYLPKHRRVSEDMFTSGEAAVGMCTIIHLLTEQLADALGDEDGDEDIPQTAPFPHPPFPACMSAYVPQNANLEDVKTLQEIIVRLCTKLHKLGAL